MSKKKPTDPGYIEKTVKFDHGTYANHLRLMPRIPIAERKEKRNMETYTKPKIGDKIYFEIDDHLHEKGVRLVHAKILRLYPKKLGECCEYLAFDCADLDNKDLVYTVPYDQKFIKTDTGRS